MRLSPRAHTHTVRRILFCCTAKERFLGIGRGGRPSHACSVTTGSEVGRGNQGISFCLNRARHRKRNSYLHLLVCERMWFKSKIISNMKTWSCLYDRWSIKICIWHKKGLSQWPFEQWDRGFEFHSRHWGSYASFSFVFVPCEWTSRRPGGAVNSRKKKLRKSQKNSSVKPRLREDRKATRTHNTTLRLRLPPYATSSQYNKAEDTLI